MPAPAAEFFGVSLTQARGVEPVVLGSRALDLLLLLVERHGEIVPKDAIFDAVWRGAAIEESNLSVQISTLRHILDQGRAEGSCVQTIPRRGYRFVASVKRCAASSGSPLALPLPDKPSIAVLPFQNLGGDPQQAYFADGMVEEIIAALARIPSLFVIAQDSIFTYKGQAVDVRQVGRELGVRYVLEGSVRRASNQLRIVTQLVETETAVHLWADRFEGSLEDVFDLQDQVALSVAGVIEPALQAAETRRIADRPTKDLNAYDLYLRSLPLLFHLSSQDLSAAAQLLERAIALDPDFGPALAFASICQMRLAVDGWDENPKESRRKAETFARRAIELESNDPAVLANSAYTLQAFGEDVSTMAALVDRALALNPSYARGWYISGWLQLAAGKPDTAIEHIERSLRLNPRGYIGVPTLVTSWAHFASRRFDAAIKDFRLAMQQVPGSPWPYRGLAASFAHMGRLDEAREMVRRLNAIGAAAIPTEGNAASLQVDELLNSGLRLAMMGA